MSSEDPTKKSGGKAEKHAVIAAEFTETTEADVGKSADSNDEDTAEITGPKCSTCAKRKAEYRCDPCGCNLFCKKCAMKMATGGKCKTCNQMFVSMTMISETSTA